MNKEEYIYGTRAVIEAIKDGRPVDKILVKKGISNELVSQLLPLMKDHGIPFQFVPLEKINRISRKNHQGVLAFLSPIEFEDIEMLLPGLFESGADPLIVAVDKVTDVRNFGAIARSAECGGVHAIIIPRKGMARIGADAVKTSAGALNYIPVCKSANLASSIRFLKNSGIRIIAAYEKATKSYTDSKMDVPLCIILGSEDKGISPKILDMADEQVRIPLYGKIESLNVSVAAALIIFEAVRQRGVIP
jgi:23S rRNA (guanosine2251-2'-O)-methyltransferase